MLSSCPLSSSVACTSLECLHLCISVRMFLRCGAQTTIAHNRRRLWLTQHTHITRHRRENTVDHKMPFFIFVINRWARKSAILCAGRSHYIRYRVRVINSNDGLRFGCTKTQLTRQLWWRFYRWRIYLIVGRSYRSLGQLDWTTLNKMSTNIRVLDHWPSTGNWPSSWLTQCWPTR